MCETEPLSPLGSAFMRGGEGWMHKPQCFPILYKLSKKLF